MIELATIANVFQIIEAVAVVATLLFIALQIRETRRIAAADSYQGLFQSVNQFYNTLSMNEGFASIYLEGRKNPAALNNEERARFFYACVQWFCFYENLYLQYSHGLLPKQYFDAWCGAFRHDLRDLGFVLYWKQERLDFAKEFRDYVDQIITSHGEPDVANLDPEQLLLPKLGMHTEIVTKPAQAIETDTVTKPAQATDKVSAS
jgi:hypothetical protein